MLHELRHLDLSTLEEMYGNESDKLKSLLLSGARWEDVQEQRYKLIELEITLYQKIRFKKVNTLVRNTTMNTNINWQEGVR